MNKAVFLDRDGVINEVCYHHEFGIYSPTNMEEFKMNEGAEEAIKEIHRKGFLAIVITNQPGVAYEHIKKEELDKMHKYIKELGIDQVYMCIHHPADGCACHKPRKGLIHAAVEDFEIDLSESYFIGDNLTDIQAGSDCKNTILIGSQRADVYNMMEKMKIFPDYYVTNITDAVKLCK